MTEVWKQFRVEKLLSMYPLSYVSIYRYIHQSPNDKKNSTIFTFCKFS